MIVFVNGAFVESGSAVSAEDRGLLIGHGAFETLLADDGSCAFLEPHLQRLQRGLEALAVSFTATSVDWRAIARRLAQRNRMSGRAAIRLTVTAGAGGRGMTGSDPTPTLLVSLTALSPAPSTYRLMLARQRRHSGSVGARCKLIGGYVDNLAALAEARAAGVDEAVLLNESGGVACASAANIFLISSDGAVATPRIEDAALPGVVRSLLLAGDHGVPIAERAIRPGELSAGLVFLTNSLRGVAPCAGDPPSAQAIRSLSILQSWYADALALNLRKG